MTDTPTPPDVAAKLAETMQLMRQHWPEAPSLWFDIPVEQVDAAIARLRAPGPVSPQGDARTFPGGERGRNAAEKIVAGLRDAIAGNFARVTIDGQTWERADPRPSDREAALREADMRAFGASDAACYLWPEDTDEHKALRAAYCRGAADCGGWE